VLKTCLTCSNSMNWFNKKEIRLTVILSALAGINIIFIFLFQLYIVTTVGPGFETDALFAAMVVPQFVLAVGSASLTHVLVPLLVSCEKAYFDKEAWNILQIVGFVFTFIATMLFISLRVWVPLMFPGFDVKTLALTKLLIKLQLLGMVFIALKAVLWSVFHARQRFIWVQTSQLLGVIISFIFLIWTLPRFGIIMAAWAVVLRGILHVLFLAPGLGLYYWPNLHSKTIKEVWSRFWPLMLGTSYFKTDFIVDRILASLAPAGSVTLLHLAQQLYSGGHTILSRAVTAPMVPILASHANRLDWVGFKIIIYKRFLMVTVATGVVFLGIILIGKQPLYYLFVRQQFTASDLSLLWILMVALVGFWIGGGVGQILSSSFYAKGNTSTPTKIGIFCFTLGLIFKTGGFYFGGLIGLAVGSTVYFFLQAAVLSYFFEKEVRFH